MNLTEKKALYVKANTAYNNGKASPLTDAQFDKLEREIAKAEPDWPQLRKTGAPVNKKVEVRLKEFMPSLSKAYPETIAKWLAKRNDTLLALHKLDGSALQVEFVNGKPVKVRTRGDGTLGKDISFLIPHLNLPRLKATASSVVVRCEAVMKQKTYQAKWSVEALGKKEGFDNARNMVAGLLNRREPHAGLADIDIVVLGVYHMGIEEGLQWALKQGLIVADHERINKGDDLEAMLIKQRKATRYEIDGLVLIEPDQQFTYDSADRPKFTIAFKVNHDDDAVETKVVQIIGQVSRNNRITPKIKVDPVKMKGVTVTYATAHNAQWMLDRGIGEGAIVKLVRSGDVIPKIVGVTKKAKKPWVPEVPYKQVGVHFIATERHKEADVREIHHFFHVLGIENLARKGIANLYDNGFTTVVDYLKAFANDKPFNMEATYPGIKTQIEATRGMEQVVAAGLGWSMASKVFAEFERVLVEEGVTLVQMMNASNCWETFGERKLQLIQDDYEKKGGTNIHSHFIRKTETWMREQKNRMPIVLIKGMGTKSADLYFEGLIDFQPWFLEVMRTFKIKINKPEPKVEKKVVKGTLSGVNVSFTGYRDKEHEAWVEAQGGLVIAFGSKTTILIYKEGGKASSKVGKAQDAGKTVYTFDELKRKCK